PAGLNLKIAIGQVLKPRVAGGFPPSSPFRHETVELLHRLLAVGLSFDQKPLPAVVPDVPRIRRFPIPGPCVSRHRRTSPTGFRAKYRAAGVRRIVVTACRVASCNAVVRVYLVKSDNYGGWTSGLRWLMWLTPLWLLCLLPAADRLAGRRGGRALGYVLLAGLGVSARYPPLDPRRPPRVYNPFPAAARGPLLVR